MRADHENESKQYWRHRFHICSNFGCGGLDFLNGLYLCADCPNYYRTTDVSCLSNNPSLFMVRFTLLRPATQDSLALKNYIEILSGDIFWKSFLITMLPPWWRCLEFSID
jgi:hypothetical protein